MFFSIFVVAPKIKLDANFILLYFFSFQFHFKFIISLYHIIFDCIRILPNHIFIFHHTYFIYKDFIRYIIRYIFYFHFHITISSIAIQKLNTKSRHITIMFSLFLNCYSFI